MVKWLRDGNLIYALMHHGWRNGIEMFQNRIAIRAEFHSSVDAIERDQIMRLHLAAEELFYLLKEHRLPGECLPNDEWMRHVDRVISEVEGKNHG